MTSVFSYMTLLGFFEKSDFALDPVFGELILEIETYDTFLDLTLLSSCPILFTKEVSDSC